MGTCTASLFSYHKFVDLAVHETQLRTNLVPHPLQQKFNSIKAKDGRTNLKMMSFRAPKIRLMRSLAIDGGHTMQVLDLAVLPEPMYDLPIFCANIFTSATMSIVVLDLNPLFDVTIQRDYKEKYYRKLMPLVHRYGELLPWGGKITSESMRFFSPIVIWSKFIPSKCKQDVLFFSFRDYLKAWLELMDIVVAETNPCEILRNHEMQHRYLTWRAEKDPGHPILKKLVGEILAKDLVRQYLFEGVDSMGVKSFLDYFPEYSTGTGTVEQKRSMMGKSYETRPWNSEGEFIDK